MRCLILPSRQTCKFLGKFRRHRHAGGRSLPSALNGLGERGKSYRTTALPEDFYPETPSSSTLNWRNQALSTNWMARTFV